MTPSSRSCSATRARSAPTLRGGLVTLTAFAATLAPLTLPSYAAPSPQVLAVAGDAVDATSVTLTLPTQSRSDVARAVSVAVADAAGAPVPDRQVVVEVADGDAWTAAADLRSGADGTASGEVLVPRTPADQRWRARVVPADADDSPVLSEEQTVSLVPWRTRVRRSGPARVVDGKRITQTWTVTTPRGAPVAGATLVVRGRVGGRLDRTVSTTDDTGSVTLRDRPRRNSRWVARLRAGSWHAGSASAVAKVDNVPSGPVVRLPRAAPRPRLRVPKQPRAMLAGPRPSVTRIPTAVWREMRGVTWRRGCPVGRRDLRLVKVSYWAYDGYARRGEIVVNAAAADNVAATFADVYRARLPIRSMYRVDRFGYSSRVRGGDDFASMDAGNTSGFNCRRVVNYSALSPHAYGFAIDINTWENPYRSRTGIVPNTYWQSRSHPLVAWRSTAHPMVQTLFRNGWSWPYGLGDTQHFSAPSAGRYARAARAAEAAEHELEHAAGHDDLTGYVPGSRIPLD